MTLEEFEEIMESEIESDYLKSRIFLGLQIIRKYIPSADIEAAEHDEVYCVDSDKLAFLITKEDAIELRKLAWFIDQDSLAHFT